MTSSPRKAGPDVPNLGSRPLTGREHAMAAPLAAWLLSEMIWRLRDGSPADDLLWDGAQSNFETGCMALERVGLMQGEDRYWRVLRHPSTVLKLPVSTTRRDLDALLNALACHAPYVDALCPFGAPILPDTPELTTVCEGLIICGYMVAETVPKTWIFGSAQEVLHWTPAFDPWLVLNGGLELKDIPPARADAIDDLLAKLPPDVVTHLSGRLCAHAPMFIRYFMGGWTGTTWLSARDPARKLHAGIPESGWDLALISGLYARLHG